MSRAGEAFRRHPRLTLVLVDVLLLALLALCVEGAGKLVGLLRPAYEVVFLEPDAAIGWKHVPGFRFTWTGTHWYAADFSVPIQSNAYGFRDRERTLPKAPDVTRIALLGDSLVEALQVPLEETAGQLLEARLNARSAPGRRFEVLNFGVSGFSVGQYLLTWEAYASRFEPDTVFAFVSGVQLQRTTRPRMFGALPGGQQLRARPTFSAGGGLRPEPAGDLDELLRLHRALDREGRIHRKSPSLLSILAAEASSAFTAPESDGGRAAARSQGRLLSGRVGPDAMGVNLEILGELARQVRGAGAQLVLVDASLYFDPEATELTATLEGFCAERGLGYLPLARDLLAAEAKGLATHWQHDAHFNEAGNRIFAEAMVRWLDSEDAPGTQRALPPAPRR